MPSRGPATVRFLEREPRRCALKDAAEMETNHWCHNLVLACFTCIPSIFILAGAGVGLGIPLNMGVDGAAKAAGAGTYAIIIGVTLVFVYRALSIKEAHAVICCLSSRPCFTEFNNVKVMTPQDHEVQRDAEERAQAALRNQRMERERAIELEPRTSQFRGPFKDYCKPLAPYCVSADGMRIYGRVPTTHKQHTRAYVLPLCLHTCLCPQLGGNPCPFEGDVLQETHIYANTCLMCVQEGDKPLSNCDDIAAECAEDCIFKWCCWWCASVKAVRVTSV